MQEKFKELSKTFKLGGIIINNIYEKLIFIHPVHYLMKPWTIQSK